MNKIAISAIVFVLILSNICCSQAQNNENQIISMLKKFYTEYNDVWTTKPPLAPAIFNDKIDMLLKKYCTSRLRNKANKYLKDGHDLLTNDLASVDLNENLKIEKDSTKKNIYVVKFTAANSNASGKLIKQEVILHVSVVREEDGYKINEIH